MSLPGRVALGTMHGKAAAIAPPLARLGIAVVVPEGLDTDRFGTFTGEVPRAGSMIEAARAKAQAAIAASGLPVGLASEGAYGPHPVLPFLAWGLELLLWLDSRTGQEIVETLADEAPLYGHADATGPGDCDAFLARIGFPATAVVVAPAAEPLRPVAKGIRDRVALKSALRAASATGPARVATDMRAHMNPRRMAMIARLAEHLADRLGRTCTACGAPGWGRLRLEPGLPCAWCGGPSVLARGEVHGCTACGVERFVLRPDKLTAADPGCCPACNP
ncbi:MAG TPA: hypothetical protein GX405_06750 [Rhizobiales bacterium]|nr:hypothetical protein [Hyphomicrobiales bacterium]